MYKCNVLAFHFNLLCVFWFFLSCSRVQYVFWYFVFV